MATEKKPVIVKLGYGDGPRRDLDEVKDILDEAHKLAGLYEHGVSDAKAVRLALRAFILNSKNAG